MTALVSVEVKGLAQAIEIMAAVDKDADFAQATALRAGARRARSLAAKKAAGQLGLPMKIFRRRIAWFSRRRRRMGERRAVLWGGLKYEPRASEHPKLAKAIQAANPGAFFINVKGVRKLVARRAGKLISPTLDLDTVINDVLPDAAVTAMAERYIPTLIKEFNRRVERRARRR